MCVCERDEQPLPHFCSGSNYGDDLFPAIALLDDLISSPSVWRGEEKEDTVQQFSSLLFFKHTLFSFFSPSLALRSSVPWQNIAVMHSSRDRATWPLKLVI